MVRWMSSTLVGIRTNASLVNNSVVNERVQVPEGATLAAIEDPEGNPLVLVQQ